jgi:hypothetical protein
MIKYLLHFFDRASEIGLHPPFLLTVMMIESENKNTACIASRTGYPPIPEIPGFLVKWEIIAVRGSLL